jgi:hypothetical protein
VDLTAFVQGAKQLFSPPSMVGTPELQEQIPALQRVPARVASTAALLQEIAAAVNG